LPWFLVLIFLAAESEDRRGFFVFDGVAVVLFIIVLDVFTIFTVVVLYLIKKGRLF